RSAREHREHARGVARGGPLLPGPMSPVRHGATADVNRSTGPVADCSTRSPRTPGTIDGARPAPRAVAVSWPRTTDTVTDAKASPARASRDVASAYPASTDPPSTRAAWTAPFATDWAVFCAWNHSMPCTIA